MSSARIRWGRAVVGGILLEAVLLVAAIPLLAIVDNPFAESAAGDFTVFFVAVAVACFLAGGLGGAWVGRRLTSRFALHGMLAGVVATAIYLAICSIPPNTIPAVAAAYGAFWFSLLNGLRILG